MAKPAEKPATPPPLLRTADAIRSAHQARRDGRRLATLVKRLAKKDGH